MKKKHVFLSILFLGGAASLSFGQDDIKEWKHKMKQLTPEQYKQLVQENERLKQEVVDAGTEAEHFKSESASKDAQIAKLEQEISDAKTVAAAPALVPLEMPEPAPVVAEPVATPVTRTALKPESPSISGTVFRVQIGAFRNKNLEKYLNNSKNFSGEVDADGSRKYTLGEFTEFSEADNFKDYLREMGVKDAWVVCYKNGKRVALKDAH